MSVLDVFNNSAFSTTSLTSAVNKMPFLPGRAGRLGIFDEAGIDTTTVMIEQRDGVLQLIPDTPRGAPPRQHNSNRREARTFRVPHFPLEGAIMADEIQNVRMFGSENQLETIQAKVSEKLEEMLRSLDATVEYGRIGAIKGIILDADGSTVIHDLFTEFGVTQIVVSFELDVDTTVVRGICLDVKNQIEDELGDATYDHIHAFCGADFFKSLIDHPDVREAYQRWLDGQALRNDPRFTGFEFAEIMFEQYRGAVSGVPFVAANEAHLFPVGTPGLFKTRFAPADFVEAANTIGLPRYAKQERMRFDKGIELHEQTNPFSYCERPKVLVKATLT